MVLFLKSSNQGLQHRCGVELLRSIFLDPSKANDDRILPTLKEFLTKKSQDSPMLQVFFQAYLLRCCILPPFAALSHVCSVRFEALVAMHLREYPLKAHVTPKLART
jgi:hypothetical protein